MTSHELAIKLLALPEAPAVCVDGCCSVVQLGTPVRVEAAAGSSFEVILEGYGGPYPIVLLTDREAADVANFAMMVADVVGSLRTDK